jgi:predicted ester cyclase
MSVTEAHRKALACEFVETVGSEDFLAALGLCRAALPDLSLEVEEVVAEGEKVVVFMVLRGTHTGALPGLPPTGRRVCVRGVGILRVPEGEVRGHRVLFDLPSLMRQLGVLWEEEACNGHRNGRQVDDR